MQLSETVKLYPTEYQIELTRNTMSEYISTVNILFLIILIKIMEILKVLKKLKILKVFLN